MALETARLEDEQIILREWSDGDLMQMVSLFDDPEVAFRTPFASPFDYQAAEAHLRMTQRAQAAGERLYLVITAADDVPRGEVVLNLMSQSIGYAVGAEYRGRGLATRALRLVTRYAHEVASLPRVYLEIEADNLGSISVARAAGFRPADAAPEVVEDKGRRYALHLWEHDDSRQ